MLLNISSGELQIDNSIRLYPGMTRRDLLSQSPTWKIWTTAGTEPSSYRLVLNETPEVGGKRLIVIVFFAPNDGPMLEWNLKPMGEFNGPQNKPEGKYTKAARAWFQSVCGVELPVNRDWGSIDAAYDMHNLTTLIIFTPSQK